MNRKIKMYETEDHILLTADEVSNILRYALKINALPDEEDFDKKAFKCSGILRIKYASVYDIIKSGRFLLAVALYSELYDKTVNPFSFSQMCKMLKKVEFIYRYNTEIRNNTF